MKVYKVCVLMSTYNGEMYIRQQLDSIMCQREVQTKLLIRDDGSSDSTVQIIKEYIEKYPYFIECINLNERKNIGYAKSFFTLLKYALERYFEEFDFYSFADQDDVWLENKLVQACKKISQNNTPTLYFSAKKIVDQNLNILRPDICNYHAIVEDIFERSNAFGCTMVLNKKYADFFREKQLEKTNFIHDAFIYRLALCAGIEVVYDKESYILYRQHTCNAVGAIENDTFLEQIKKVKKVFNKREHYLQNIICYIETEFASYLSGYNQKMVNMISTYNISLSKKVKLLFCFLKGSKSQFSKKIIISLKIIFNYI